MNSLERVLAALQNQPADRPAFFLNSSLYGARLTGASLEAHFTDAAAYTEGQIAIRDTFGPDLLTSSFCLPAFGEAFGSTWRLRHGHVPNIAQFAGRSVEDMLKMPLPDVDGHPHLVYVRETIQLLAKRYAGEVPVFGLLMGPMDIPPLVIGLEAWLDALLFQPRQAQALLDRLTPFFVALAKAMFADGATGLAITANLANTSMVPAAVADTLLLPVLKQALAELPGPVVFHHGGCPLLAQLARFQGLPQVVAYVLDADEDLAEARQILGPGPVLMGNLNGPDLVHLQPEAVQTLCDRALAPWGVDRQIILATSGADIQLETPHECLTAITDAVCRAGGVEA